MTQIALTAGLAKGFMVAIFFASLVFAAAYHHYFDWKDTITGRAALILSLSIPGALLPAVLFVFNVPTIVSADSPRTPGPWYDVSLTWLSIVSAATALGAILVLTWEILRTIRADQRNSPKWMKSKWASKFLNGTTRR